MKTSNSIQNTNESKSTEFFTKGKKYRCIKTAVMKKGGETAFKAGSIYEQTNEPTHWVGWLRNEQAARHMAEFVYYTRRGYNLKQIWEASAKRA